MKELENIYKELVGCNTLLLKSAGQELECYFIKKGVFRKVVVVKDQVLARSLLPLSTNGILEGLDLQILQNNFSSFSLHVRALKLFLDLNFTLKRIDSRLEEVIAA